MTDRTLSLLADPPQAANLGLNLPLFPESLSVYVKLFGRIGSPNGKKITVLRHHVYKVWLSTVEEIDNRRLLGSYPS